MRFAQPRKVALAVGAWLILLAGAIGATHAYMGRPGPSGAPAMRWPEGSGLALGTDRPTMVVFVHPRCPCTSATLQNLSLAMADEQTGEPRSVSVIVVLSGPAATGVDDALVARFAPLGSPRIIADPSGAIASSFGAATSGHVVLCGADRLVRFSGGVTPGRGHTGRCGSLGMLDRAIAEAQTNQPVQAVLEPSPVYGCPLFDGGRCAASDSTTVSTGADHEPAACCGQKSNQP